MKRMRLERGATLESVAAVTKIRLGMLEHLESGDFEKLPNRVFTEGFIRSYAETLGLEEADLLRRYRELRPEGPAAFMPVDAVNTGRSHWILYLALAVLLLGGGSGLWWKIRGDSRTAAPARSGALSHRLPGTFELPAGGGNPRPEEPGAGLPAREPASDLRITATDACWVEIWEGGVRRAYRLLEDGEVLSLDGASFMLKLGNRGAVQVRWRGRAVEPPPGDSQVVSRWCLPTGEGTAE